jgi:mannose-6-phosphate isomerase-like protein (cupin superfamily)
MQIWQAENLAAEQNRSYGEFLRVPAMSMGIYKLPAGGIDPQSPHNEDESYYVVRGRAKIEVKGETQAVQAGTVIFVPAHALHRFKEIEEDLVLLVFFAPAESSK